MCQETDTELWRRQTGEPMSRTVRLLAFAVAGLTAAWAVTGCGSSSSGTTASTATIKATTTPAPKASTQTSPATATQTSPATATPTSPATATKTSPAPATGVPAGVGVVTGSTGGVTATLRAGTHHPKVSAAWPIHFTVTEAGRPAKASVSYEYLFAGQVVAKRSRYTFDGHFSDTFRWPSSAVGYPLTFRAVIVSGGSTIDLDYPVQVVT